MIVMSEEHKTVTAMRLTAAVAQKRIRDIAAVTEHVIMGSHARQRMREREIFDVDVFRVLRQGFVEGNPELTDRQEWKCKLTLKIRGGRAAGVVTIILLSGKLFVKTVEWEDLP
jgi:hypothetical protein